MVAIVVASLVGLTAATAFAAAPRLILVDGGGLSGPIVLADWLENGTLLSEWKLAQPARNPQPRCRPAYRLSLMWGPEWNDYVDSGVVLGVKVATAKQLRILRRHGVPVRAPRAVAAGCRAPSS
jgi:hypothetical protein